MSTDLEIPRSEATSPDHFPRRFLRRSVARMVRSTTIPLLILAGIALSTPEATAGSVVYSMVDYPSLQNGYSVGGTITATNGSISAWDITISQGTDLLVTFVPNNSNFDSSPTVTSSEIYAPAESDTGLYLNTNPITSFIEWDTLGSTYAGAISIQNQEGWLQTDNIPADQPFTIATLAPTPVPEPSSCVLAVVGC